MSEVEIDAYNIEAKFLDKVLEFVEEDIDNALKNFLDSPNKIHFHELTNSVILLLNKLSRSSRIKKNFFEEINGDFSDIAEQLENNGEDTLPINALLKILNKINRQISSASLFTKPSYMGGKSGYIEEGPDEE